MTTNADQAVSLIDTATQPRRTTVVVGEYPIDVAVSPDGSRVHVTNRDDGTVWAINTATMTVVATVALGAEALWPDRRHCDGRAGGQRHLRRTTVALGRLQRHQRFQPGAITYGTASNDFIIRTVDPIASPALAVTTSSSARAASTDSRASRQGHPLRGDLQRPTRGQGGRRRAVRRRPRRRTPAVWA